VALLVFIATLAAVLSWLCRSRRISGRATRLALGYLLLVNELVWWVFRYSREGIHLPNLPLQLCDLTLWATVAICLFPRRTLLELSYFAGLAGAGMALLTPDLLWPWPSYPAIYFFLAHGGLVIANLVLVYGGIVPLAPGAPWRAFAMLVAYSAAMGVFDALSGANYMYLCRKPHDATLLNVLGPWPIYVVPCLALALGLYWLLWLVRPRFGGGYEANSHLARPKK
jgi:hypothetical integral membrane protein (TIGR02206 family)